MKGDRGDINMKRNLLRKFRGMKQEAETVLASHQQEFPGGCTSDCHINGELRTKILVLVEVIKETLNA